MKSKLMIGVVNYDLGNHASVRRSFLNLGFRCKISDEPSILCNCDLLVLPGVGAFPPAMMSLQKKLLDEFLLEQADKQKFILGICLGMQLLTEGSYENGFTHGLGLIPGKFIPIGNNSHHIGWNTLTSSATFIKEHVADQLFYFNHSYIYEGEMQYQVGYTFYKTNFASIIQRDNVLGVQFHPEKSQTLGRYFLKHIIAEFCHA